MRTWTNWYLVYAVTLGLSFSISLGLTYVVRYYALRWQILDHPSARKLQKRPVPLLGGVSIVATCYVMVVGSLLLVEPVRQFGIEWLEIHVFQFLGKDHETKLLGIFGGGLLIAILGLVDDLHTLRPSLKLVGQCVAALVLVLSDMRLNLFAETWLGHRSTATIVVSGVLTVLWVVFMTNSMNLLDNMDGLCAGVAAIAAFSFFICALRTREAFICVLLMVFAGAVLGFLVLNLYPARIYMGDTGAMFCGYLLATLSILITFYNESTPSRIAVAAPLLALSVPIFDTVSVTYIRWRANVPIFLGDRRHFSHRLVNIGMTQQQAVEFIYLVAAVTGLGAGLLRQVNTLGTVIILAQTCGLFLLIVLVMRAGDKGWRIPSRAKTTTAKRPRGRYF
ncbi:MAG: MraY family glycosyltransferase [Candidatus Hydrogenedentales bacterium]|jgi:UDP-GlcNAc:undecaprenyl-phosphate GlcNAc-1-phosphate transferase